MRILVVEDDPALSDALAAAFADAGIACDFAISAARASDLLRLYHFDAAVIDRGLPDADGLNLVRDARRAGERLPIIMLTAQSSVLDRVEGLDSGADDYIGKPFAFAELRARLDALIRRADGRANDVVRCGNLAYDLTTRSAAIDDRAIDLSPRDRAMLEALLRGQGRTVAWQTLEDQLCGSEGGISLNALEVSMHRLRRRLVAMGCTAVIQNVRGVGYSMKAPA
ncbi:MAG: response regulator [Sphingomonadales bacterium]|nr:response regulator [Sphingomonadales bacterium]MDE2570723.1 response regulator [Sphingomonadales bacterium]